jgi:transcriptional regulator with XRE-family HTH domain
MKQTEENIIKNIIKIRNDREIKQATIALEIEIDSSTYSKIESGQIGLSVERLAKIASCFNMSIIDVIAYPKKYIDTDSLSEEEREKHKPKVVLQLELEEDKKEQVLKLVFGANNLEILNK